MHGLHSTRPLKRVVDGGNGIGELVAELYRGGVLLRRPRERKEHGYFVSWNSIYYHGAKVKAEEERDARLARRAVPRHA